MAYINSAEDLISEARRLKDILRKDEEARVKAHYERIEESRRREFEESMDRELRRR